MTDTSLKLYTAEEVRRLDACAIGEHGIEGYELMNRAGRAVLNAARARFPDTCRWLVLCGSGNNGGDGYVITRLAREQGIDVTLCALKPAVALSGDAATAAQDYLAAGGVCNEWPVSSPADFDLAFDAMLGTGLDREVGGRYREVIDFINGSAFPVVAVDIPSGLHADTGRCMGSTVAAALTVTFIGLKRGMYTADGPDHCGEVVFDDLQTPPVIHDATPDYGELIREKIIIKYLVKRLKNSHKGNYGHVLVVGGNQGMGGAVRMSGEAALRSGAGLVSIATHPVHASVLNLGRPELMVSGAAQASDLSPLLDRASVIAAGPGIGVSKWAGELLDRCLETTLPAVVDADGLNLLAGGNSSRDNWILTPHPAEAARLLGSDTAAIQADRVAAARALARKFNAVVVLKGCGTIMASPAGRYAICALGNPGMATGGSGDVLTGVVAGLLAQGLDTWQAAVTGVAAHAAAGDRAAAIGGERGLLASDISLQLPRVLNP
jgi:NAD(P)H-hydrate epimerase